LKKRAKLILLAVSVVLSALMGMLLFATLMFSGGNALASNCGSTDPMAPQAALSGTGPNAAADPSKLTNEQISNARLIIGVGQGMGASPNDVKLAVWVAYHESGLRNLTYGTGDSLGLFQQTHFWGTPEQRLNPVYASSRFYTKLFEAADRNQLYAQGDFLDVALEVQRPKAGAYTSPEHNFLDWEPVVNALLDLIGINASASSPDLNQAGFDTVCSQSTYLGVPGSVIIAPGANNPGEPITPVTLGFLQQVAGIYGKAIICTTGTNHSYLTVDGTVSDHASGHACDFGMAANGGSDDGPVGDALARACLIAAGVNPVEATAEADAGGLYTYEHNGLRIQCIWKTNEGGNHHNHVHIGANTN
jgi:hypothetical protein